MLFLCESPLWFQTKWVFSSCFGCCCFVLVYSLSIAIRLFFFSFWVPVLNQWVWLGVIYFVYTFSLLSFILSFFPSRWKQLFVIILFWFFRQMEQGKWETQTSGNWQVFFDYEYCGQKYITFKTTFFFKISPDWLFLSWTSSPWLSRGSWCIVLMFPQHQRSLHISLTDFQNFHG